jgi:hypothetical protein
MLRPVVVAVAISLLSGSVPALAQNFKGSCEQFCREKRCAAGNAAFTMNTCMAKCVPNCRMKNPNAK